MKKFIILVALVAAGIGGATQADADNQFFGPNIDAPAVVTKATDFIGPAIVTSVAPVLADAPFFGPAS